MPDVRPQTRPPPPPHVPLARRLAMADRHREPVAQPVAAQPRANILPAIVSGGFGFVVGAMFWHMIGFWGFVERVLRGPPSEQARIERVVAPTGEMASRLPLPVNPGRQRLVVTECTMMAKPADAGAVWTLPCPANAAAMPVGEGLERADRLALTPPPAPMGAVQPPLAGLQAPPPLRLPATSAWSTSTQSVAAGKRP